MSYYKSGANIMARLQSRIEGLGMPVVLLRKFNMLVGAITVQVEDEWSSRPVIDTVFDALIQQADEIRQPESDQIKAWIAECRAEITKRLVKRERQTRA